MIIKSGFQQAKNGSSGSETHHGFKVLMGFVALSATAPCVALPPASISCEAGINSDKLFEFKPYF